MVGGSLDGKKREIDSYIFMVPHFTKNGRFYSEIYRKEIINEGRRDEYAVFQYRGTTLTESMKAADALGSHKKDSDSKVSSFQANLAKWLANSQRMVHKPWEVDNE